MARQIGGWVGKARQMTRALQRQLEEELDVEKNIGINPKDLTPDALLSPRDDDTYSPLHEESATEAETSADDVTTEKKADDD